MTCGDSMTALRAKAVPVSRWHPGGRVLVKWCDDWEVRGREGTVAVAAVDD